MYALLITEGSLNFFGEEGYWSAYGAQLFQFLDGQLDIPEAAIQQEGWFFGGKVYMSYGLLPAILRLPLLPFIDLAVTPVSRLVVWLLITASVLIIQSLINQTWRAQTGGDRTINRLVFVLVSIVVWFNSGYLIIIQNAAIYHEPYAVSLFCFSLVFYYFVKCFILQKTSYSTCAAVTALCAVASLHGRPTMAVGLFVAAGFIVLAHLFDLYRQQPEGQQLRRINALLQVVWKNGFSILVVLVGSVSYLALNYARFDSLFFMTEIESYGFFRAGEGYSERLSALQEFGAFNIRRIIPNGIYYLVGGYDLHSQLVQAFDVGFIRKEMSIALIYIWLVPLLAFMGALGYGVKQVRAGWSRKHTAGLALTVCTSLGALLQLSYTTATYRYMSEFWPFVMTAIVWVYILLARRGGFEGVFVKKTVYAAIIIAVISTAVSLNFYRGYYDAWNPDGNVIITAIVTQGSH
ncbi:MAG: hypothetical protein COB37_12055 [Kordiimonadales bacterium]|nr:MAG: hypothetical protein COB37_12055 [Kordiimonadales bacterium]